MSSLARVLWLSLALAPWLTAQAPQAAGGNDRHPRRPAPMPAPLADPDTLWRVPLHTNAADPVAGPYGWWAGGRGYKASFHDGFVFYPYLGPDCPENLPLRWTTERVSAGGEALADLRHCDHVHGAQRYEYRYGAVTERYDVRDDGVEQSFVIAASPARPGDLVVRGRVTSRLRCTPVGAAPQALTFADEDGRAVVRYGEALAFDAAGERVPVATSFDGEAITLTVPAAWLARATWPVTVDPLTAPALVFSSTLPRISFTDVAHDLESHEILTVFGLEFSATDYDVRGFFVDNALGGVLQVYADLSSAYSNVHSQCCIVGGADKWAIATGREFNTGAANVAVYVHPRAFYTLNGGWTKLVTRGAVFDHHPSIGGSTHSNVNNKALLAWRREIGATASAVWGTVVDVNAQGDIAAAAQFPLEPLASVDQEWPCVNKCSNGGDWLVVWQEYDNNTANDDWDIDAAVVLTNGTVFQRFRLGLDNSPDHKLLPKIEGNDGRYFYSCTLKPNDGRNTSLLGSRIGVQQFDWTGTLMLRTGLVTIDSAPGLSLTTGPGNRGIGYDRTTVSHAVVTYDDASGSMRMQRVGFQARGVETQLVGGFAHGGGVVYNPDTLKFLVTWGANATPRSAFIAHLDYEAARCNGYGTSCQGGALACRNANLPFPLAGPHRGSSQFALLLRNGPASSACVPVIGFATGNVPLPGGCPLLLDPGLPLIVLPGATVSSGGEVDYPLPIAETLAPGDIYAQWAMLTPMQQLRTSNASQLQVR